MQINNNYFIASFFSFSIHATLILVLIGFFYNEKPQRPILSKPIEVNLLLENKTQKKEVEQRLVTDVIEVPVNNMSIEVNKTEPIEPTMTLDMASIDSGVNELLNEDAKLTDNFEVNQINEFSQAMIRLIESAWIKPKNIQQGLVCNLKIQINRNGRIISVNLLKSSGNIRFDNSAIKAVNRVETFNFFDRLDNKMYQSNFRNVTLTFNPQ